MTGAQRWIFRITVAGLTCFLAGCFFSYDPILTAENARARPLVQGLWDWCEVSGGNSEPSCETISIARMADREYRFQPTTSDAENAEEPLIFRFRKIGPGVWLGQAKDVEDAGDTDDTDENNPYFFYRLERKARRDFRLFWLDCRLTPPGLVGRLLEEGQIENTEPGRALAENGNPESCLVKTLEAAIDVARAATYERETVSHIRLRWKQAAP